MWILPARRSTALCKTPRKKYIQLKNLEIFSDELNHASLDNTYYLIGLGDSSYDTYCGAAEKLTQQLQNTGATELSSPLLIDVLQHPIPEDVAVAWLKQQLT